MGGVLLCQSGYSRGQPGWAEGPLCDTAVSAVAGSGVDGVRYDHSSK